MEEKYTAFISYRHKKLDHIIATQLHRRIERWRIPKKLRRHDVKTLGRVFRDEDELNAGNDLTAKIYQALDNSEYLIVVCTPNTPESNWVDQEIQYFIRRHGRDRILTVLADGTPSTSLPPVLTQVLDEQGQVIKYTEPLCANLTSWCPVDFFKHVFSVSKLYGDEFLRLASSMLGCSFDDLKQRARRYRRMIQTAATGTVLLVLAVIAAILLQWNLEVTEKNQEISLKNQEIAQQLNQSLLNESQSLTLLSQQALSSGDRRSAVRYALNALPKEGSDRPYLPEAEVALSQALYTYQNGPLEFDTLLHHPESDGDICNIKVSPGQQYALTVGSDAIHCYDIQRESLLWSASLREFGYEFSFSQFGDDLFFFSPSGNEVIVALPYTCIRFDAATGAVIQQFSTQEVTCQHNYTGEPMAPVSISYAGSSQELLFDNTLEGTIKPSQCRSQPLDSVEYPFIYGIYADRMVLSPDGNTLAYHYQANYINMVSQAVVFYDLPSGSPQGAASICTYDFPSMGSTCASAFSPDGSRYASLYGLYDVSLSVLDTDTAQVEYLFIDKPGGFVSAGDITYLDNGCILLTYLYTPDSSSNYRCVSITLDSQGRELGRTWADLTSSAQAVNILSPLVTEDAIHWVVNTRAEAFVFSQDLHSWEGSVCPIYASPAKSFHLSADGKSIVCLLESGQFACVDLQKSTLSDDCPYSSLPFYVSYACSDGESLYVVSADTANTVHFLRPVQDPRATTLTGVLQTQFGPQSYKYLALIPFPSGDRFLAAGYWETPEDEWIYHFVLMEGTSLEIIDSFVLELEDYHSISQFGFSVDESQLFLGETPFTLDSKSFPETSYPYDRYDSKRLYQSPGEPWICGAHDFQNEILYWLVDGVSYSSPCPYPDSFTIRTGSRWDGIWFGTSGLLAMPDYTSNHYMTYSITQNTWQQIQNPTTGTDTPAIAVGNQEQIFALLDTNDTLHIFDHNKGAFRLQVPVDIDYEDIWQMAFLLDDQILTVTTQNTFYILQVSDGRMLAALPINGRSFRFHEDAGAQRLYVLGSNPDDSGLVIDTASWTALHQIGGNAIYLSEANRILSMDASGDIRVYPAYTLQDLVQAGTELLEP